MVSGHLQVKKGYYYAVLSFYDSKNKRHVKYISTGLPEKGNKRKAEAELVKIRNAFEPPAEIGELCSNMLFADYLLGWLEIVKVRVLEVDVKRNRISLSMILDPAYVPQDGVPGKEAGRFSKASGKSRKQAVFSGNAMAEAFAKLKRPI